ncbi:MAG: BRCT domain-containing protein [Gammaproteobacteria bacterium]
MLLYRFLFRFGIPEVGGNVAQDLVRHFGSLQKVRAVGRDRDAYGSEGELAALIFVFTGTLEAFTREDAEALVETHDGRATSSVSGNIDYRAAGTEPGSKHEQARERTVTLLDQTGFCELLC